LNLVQYTRLVILGYQVAHTPGTGYTPLISTESYALGQQLRLGLSINMPSKIGLHFQGGTERPSSSTLCRSVI